MYPCSIITMAVNSIKLTLTQVTTKTTRLIYVGFVADLATRK